MPKPRRHGTRNLSAAAKHALLSRTKIPTGPLERITATRPDFVVDEATRPDFVVDEATRPDFVVDEATRPDFVVDEATRPDFVVDEATRPDRLARTWHEHGTNLIYYATGGLPCKWPPSVVHYKRLPLVIVNSTRASRILREGEYSCAKSTIPT
jgi:hypothetical protein